MKRKMIFSGVATALITPFIDEGIDFGAFGKIIDFQLRSNINALVVAGTTGESATMSVKEKRKLFEFARERVPESIPLIFGTGSNDTKTAIKQTAEALRIGADAALIVTPYYNKGTELGVINHYKKIANSVDLPIILYNVPSRTGVNLSISAIEELANEKNIVAIKEASDSAERLMALSAIADKISIFSGNDSQVYMTLAVGGEGVISVASNLLPQAVKKITDSFGANDIKAALEYQQRLLPLCRVLFAETNPAPIKHAMMRRGFCREDVRLPMTPPSEKISALIDSIIDAYPES